MAQALEALTMSYLDRIRDCAVFDPVDYLPFRVADIRIGRIHRNFVGELERHASVFRIAKDGIELADNLKTVDERTNAIDRVLRALQKDGLVPGWRDERYPVTTSFQIPALFHMERAAVPLFGIQGYGVHINGFVESGDGMSMWIGRRSLTKPTGPGKLDQVVAGGQPSEKSLRENLIKECAEEAGIPAGLAAQSVSVGTISYVTERPEGLRQDVLFNFDLRLPDDFTPVNADGEVSDFYLWPIEKVMATLSDTDEFKFNSGLVIIDFLIRRGFIDADDPDYVEIVDGLHI